jgi:hypothetical protein
VQWTLSPGLKRPEWEADYSSLSSAEVRNAWNFVPTPPFVLLAWYLDTEKLYHIRKPQYRLVKLKFGCEQSKLKRTKYIEIPCTEIGKILQLCLSFICVKV